MKLRGALWAGKITIFGCFKCRSNSGLLNPSLQTWNGILGTLVSLFYVGLPYSKHLSYSSIGVSPIGGKLWSWKHPFLIQWMSAEFSLSALWGITKLKRAYWDKPNESRGDLNGWRQSERTYWRRWVLNDRKRIKYQ